MANDITAHAQCQWWWEVAVVIIWCGWWTRNQTTTCEWPNTYEHKNFMQQELYTIHSTCTLSTTSFTCSELLFDTRMKPVKVSPRNITLNKCRVHQIAKLMESTKEIHTQNSVVTWKVLLVLVGEYPLLSWGHPQSASAVRHLATANHRSVYTLHIC